MNTIWLWILSLSWLTQVWVGYGLLSAALVAFEIQRDLKNPNSSTPNSVIMMFIGIAALVIYSLVHYWQWFQLLNWCNELWVLYAVISLVVINLALAIEMAALKTPGANGLLLFTTLMMSFMGFCLMCLISLIYWFIH
jgi:hypothetical protein